MLRLDAVASCKSGWARAVSRNPRRICCQQALRACSRIASAAVLHLEEVIVGPVEMLAFLGRGVHDGREENLAYHNSLMVLFWLALASHDVRLPGHLLCSHFLDRLTNGTYLRSHGDIGGVMI